MMRTTRRAALAAAARHALAQPDVVARVSEVGFVNATGSDIAGAEAHMRGEAEKRSALIRARGLTCET